MACFRRRWIDEQYLKTGVISPATLEFPERSLEELVAKIAALPLAYQPGTQWEYSVSVDIQARIIEKLSGQSLADFLRKRIFEPLQMQDTAYYVPAQQARAPRHALSVRYRKAVPGGSRSRRRPKRAAHP